MSGLIDMWTNEMSKLNNKEKGPQSLYPHESSSHIIENDGAHIVNQEKQKMMMGSNSIGFGVAVGQFPHQANNNNKLFSEDSVSMLVEWFSP